MVFSTTFDWSLQSRGSNTAIFLQDHMRNVVMGAVGLIIFAVIDYRFWKRFAPFLLLVTVGGIGCCTHLW
jgi:cell division protein FtsW (lipid II flippase)